MANKKSTSKKSVQEKSTVIKIAEKVGELAGRIVNEKEHLVEMAGNAIQSVKSTVDNITAKKKSSVKKAAKAIVKKATKAVVKKVVKPAAKKIAKASKAKKAPAVKKAIKKIVKKTAKKVAGKKR